MTHTLQLSIYFHDYTTTAETAQPQRKTQKKTTFAKTLK